MVCPGRGIRQGDPLSPFLFILCQVWLFIKLTMYQEERKLMGVSVAWGEPRVNHLLFAEDCLFFVKAELRILAYLKDLLKQYEATAGQKINYSKSEIMGSPNIDENMLCLAKEFPNMKTVKDSLKYLGHPINLGRRKVAIFRWLEDEMKGKNHEWNAAFLSMAGKNILIKSCMRTYPICAMSCFHFPKFVCDKLNAMALKFWWASNSKNRGIHWVEKETVLRDKLHGGMVFVAWRR